MKATFCEDCDHCSKPYASATPRQWLCLKHKKATGFGHVSKELWDDGEPYFRCYRVNGGMCPLFEPRKDET